MYSIVMSIPVALEEGHRLTILDTLARDLFTHLKYEPALRVIVPRAGSQQDMGSTVTRDLRELPGLSFRLLPWNGFRNSWPAAHAAVRKVLAEEAAAADIWHTGCSRGLWDLSTVSYQVGLGHSKGTRVFCMDSDPAEMLITGGGLGRYTGRWVRMRLRRRVRLADGAIFIGRGPMEMYGRQAKSSVLTEAVWLQDGEVASEAKTAEKFMASGPARFAVPARFMAWKGLDDAIAAVGRLGERSAEFSLDLIGDGPMRPRLVALVERANLGRTVRFVAPVPYGEAFLGLLRGYHAVLIPTRGLEEARVAFDAAASGCVLIHSRTSTLESALGQVTMRWTHMPGNPESLGNAIVAALDHRESWGQAALQGLEFMRGRTIDAMHRKRARFIAQLRQGQASAPASPAARPPAQ